MNSAKKIILLFAVVALFFVLSSNITSAVDWWPLVPCGLNQPPSGATLKDPNGQNHDYTKSCTKCDLFLLVHNIMNFIVLGLIPPVAVLFFVWAGALILMGGANPKWVTEGRTIFSSTAYGIIIVLLSWMITNTVLKSFVVPGAVSNWWEFQCTETVNTTNNTNQNNNNNVTCGSSNLCQPVSASCGGSSCSQYTASISRYAGGAASANLLKAIMANESSCNISATNGDSSGLMQIKSATANIYKSQCGVSENITSAWLTSPANADKSICIAAKYINAISSSCPNQRDLIAAYNGGTGACAASNDCTSEQNCEGGKVKKWECLYDNPTHTVCNTGYNETRTYVPKVLYCLNNPGF